MAKSSKRLRRAFLAIQIGLSIFFLLWVWKMLGQTDLSKTFSNANLSLALIALALLPAGWILRAWRYKVLLEAFQPQGAKHIRVWPCIEAFMLFLAGNAALPLRGGEWLRVAHIKKQVPTLPIPYLIGAAATEKLPEFAYAALVIGIWLTFGSMNPVLFIALIVASFLSLALIAVAAGNKRATVKWPRSLSFLTDFSARFPKLQQTFNETVRSLGALGETGSTLKIVTATLAVRALDSVVMLILASSLSLELSLNASILIGAAISLGLIISALPAHVGVFQASAVAGAALAGINQADALPFSIGFHALVLAGWIMAAIASVPLLQKFVAQKGDLE